MRRIPLGCHLGVLLIILGIAGADIRGVYLGVILMGVTTVALWRRRRGTARSV